MAAPRRIDLMPATGAGQGNLKDKGIPTVRFNLSLTETTEKTCPEFTYTELIKNALPEEESLDPDDPFAAQDKAEHDKLLAIAAQFESKYQQVPKKKKKKFDRRIQDLVDLGEGYDEEDPFIDNTEAYDEIVPATLTTQHGGFYINSGLLDFRAVSDDSYDAFQMLSKKKKKKLRITSESESELGEDGKKKRGKKKKKLLDGDPSKKDKIKKKRKLSSDIEKPPKKFKFGKRGRPPKIKKTSPTVAELLNHSSNLANQNGVLSTSPKPGQMDNGDSSQGANKSKYDTTIDAVISKAVLSQSPDSGSRSPRPEQNFSPETAPKLPDNLPSQLYEVIDKIKQAARESEVGKSKFFTMKVNDILLRIENVTRPLQSSVRSTVYSHLAAYLPCGKETLVKRAKKLRLNQQDSKLREPMAKIKEAISKRMPALLEKHQVECQVAQQLKQQTKVTDGGKIDMGKESKEGKEGGSTESDEEGEKTEGGEKQKRIMAPRKKFEWDSEIRGLLCDIVRIKLEIYECSNIRSQSPEEYLKAFMEAEIKPLWPQGWIQTRMLFKESRAVHGRLTTPQNKPKKTLLMVGGGGSKSSTPVAAGATPAGSLSTSNLSVNSVGGSLSAFSTPASAPKAAVVARKEEQQRVTPGLGTTPQKAKEDERTPTLLDYAGMSYLSTAKSKVGDSTVDSSKPSISMGTTLAIGTPGLDVAATNALRSITASILSGQDSTPSSTGHKSKNWTGSFMEKFKEFAKPAKDSVREVQSGGGMGVSSRPSQPPIGSNMVSSSAVSKPVVSTTTHTKNVNARKPDSTKSQAVSSSKNTDKYSHSLAASLLTSSDVSDTYRLANQASTPLSQASPHSSSPSQDSYSGQRSSSGQLGLSPTSSGQRPTQPYSSSSSSQLTYPRTLPAQTQQQKSSSNLAGMSLLGVQQPVVGSSSDARPKPKQSPLPPPSNQTAITTTKHVTAASQKPKVVPKPVARTSTYSTQNAVNSITHKQSTPESLQKAGISTSTLVSPSAHYPPSQFTSQRSSATSHGIQSLGRAVDPPQARPANLQVQGRASANSTPTGSQPTAQRTPTQMLPPVTAAQHRKESPSQLSEALPSTGLSVSPTGRSLAKSYAFQSPPQPASGHSGNRPQNTSPIQLQKSPSTLAKVTVSPQSQATYAGLSLREIHAQHLVAQKPLGYNSTPQQLLGGQAEFPAAGTIWRTADLSATKSSSSSTFAVPKTTVSSIAHTGSLSYQGLSLGSFPRTSSPLPHSVHPQSLPTQSPEQQRLAVASGLYVGTSPPISSHSALGLNQQGAYLPVHGGLHSSVHSRAHLAPTTLHYGLPYSDPSKQPPRY